MATHKDYVDFRANAQVLEGLNIIGCFGLEEDIMYERPPEERSEKEDDDLNFNLEDFMNGVVKELNADAEVGDNAAVVKVAKKKDKDLKKNPMTKAFGEKLNEEK